MTDDSGEHGESIVGGGEGRRRCIAEMMLNIASWASYGTFLGAIFATGIAVTFVPPVAIPAIIVIVGAVTGAAIGYVRRASVVS